MNKYRVTVTTTETYLVEAGSHEGAESEAMYRASQDLLQPVDYYRDVTTEEVNEGEE